MRFHLVTGGSKRVANGPAGLAKVFAELFANGSRSDLEAFLTSTGPLDTAQLCLLARTDQAERWRRGDRRPAEEYLDRFSALEEDPDCAVDLIYHEYLLREELSERPALEEYIGRFPQHASALMDQVALHRALRESSDERVQPAASVSMGMEKTQEWPAAAARDLASPAESPATIGKYKIIGQWDRGGQAQVYRAIHPTLDTELVIKLGHEVRSQDQRARDALIAEGKILAELNHPHVARIYDLDFYHDRPFLVLEYVRGRNLRQHFQSQRPDPRQAAGLLVKVAHALSVVHERGIVHRDIKPDNLIIDLSGQPRIIDFGLARLRHAWQDEESEAGDIGGTLSFMAPEQARGESDRLDVRTDVFALGGVLYWMLTGHAPYRGHNAQQILASARRRDLDIKSLEAASAPKRLKAICLKAMAEDPAQRYESAARMARELAKVAGGRRRRYAAATLCGLPAMLAVMWTFWPGRPTLHPSPAPSSKSAGSAVTGADAVLQSRLVLDLSIARGAGEAGRPLIQAMPVYEGDNVQVRWRVPAEYYSALFWVDTAGQLYELAAVPLSMNGDIHHYAWPDPKRGRELEGPPGTEVVFVCGRRAHPPQQAEISELIASRGPFPSCANPVALEFDRGQVRQLDFPLRSFGEEVARVEADLQQATDALRSKLSERFELVHGFAFSRLPRGEEN
jgi:tRNA A-37 threonylcarbamoyl transferase component Bud32